MVVKDLSRKFRSAENFGPRPIFSETFGPVGPILSEKKRSVSRTKGSEIYFIRPRG